MKYQEWLRRTAKLQKSDELDEVNRTLEAFEKNPNAMTHKAAEKAVEEFQLWCEERLGDFNEDALDLGLFLDKWKEQLSPAPRYQEVYDKAKSYKEVWDQIEISDIPTGAPGVYEHTKNDLYTTSAKGAAQAHAIAGTGCDMSAVGQKPEYWIKLGQLTINNGVGRCFSCAAVAAYTLVKDPAFDAFIIDVAGSAAYDHHFVVLSSSGARVGKTKTIWPESSIAIDIWQGNLSKISHVFLWKNYQYKGTSGSDNKLFASLKPENRQAHRALAQQLIAKFNRKEIVVTAEQQSGMLESQDTQSVTTDRSKNIKQVTLQKVCKAKCLDCANGMKAVGVPCVTCKGEGIRWQTKDEIQESSPGEGFAPRFVHASRDGQQLQMAVHKVRCVLCARKR